MPRDLEGSVATLLPLPNRFVSTEGWRRYDFIIVGGIKRWDETTHMVQNLLRVQQSVRNVPRHPGREHFSSCVDGSWGAHTQKVVLIHSLTVENSK